jgi:hypothetical protein
MNSLEKVILNLTKFGQELDSFCIDLRDRTQDDGVRLLIYHIARWKRHIALTISSLTSVEKEEFEKLSLSKDDLTFLSERVFAAFNP